MLWPFFVDGVLENKELAMGELFHKIDVHTGSTTQTIIDT